MNNLSFSERLWWYTGAVMLALAVPMALAYMMDVREVNDINIWTKPIKFSFSLGLHFFTLAFLLRYLPKTYHSARLFGVLAILVSIAALFEMAWLMGQSMRGVPSHFNFSSSLDINLYRIAGIGAVTLIIPALFMGLKFMRMPSAPELGSGFRRGAGLGLLLTFILTLIFAGYLSSGQGHWVGASPSDADGMAITGWARDGGDLRVAHFFATHLMQILPFIGFFADKAFANNPTRAKLAVWFAAIIGTGVVILTFLQALSGKAFLA